MSVQRGQVEAFEVLFMGKSAVKADVARWVVRDSGSERGLFLLGVTRTCTSRKAVMVFGFEAPETESAADRQFSVQETYQFVVLEPGSAVNEVVARELVLKDGAFEYGPDSIAYRQY